MGTALLYLIVVMAVAAVLFGLAAMVFGRGEELAPLAPGATPTRLPARDVQGDDVRDLRFPQAVRGYRMAEVDWVLDRLADELDRTGAERDGLLARLAELESTTDQAGGTPADSPAGENAVTRPANATAAPPAEEDAVTRPAESTAAVPAARPAGESSA